MPEWPVERRRAGSLAIASPSWSSSGSPAGNWCEGRNGRAPSTRWSAPRWRSSDEAAVPESRSEKPQDKEGEGGENQVLACLQHPALHEVGEGQIHKTAEVHAEEEVDEGHAAFGR